MRRLVDNVLRLIAPDTEVRETNYFKTSPKAKDKNGNPTRKARIYFAINLDEENSEHLKRLGSLADGFLEAYDNLSAWDHVPLKKHNFVYGSFIAIEGCLISILGEANI